MKVNEKILNLIEQSPIKFNEEGIPDKVYYSYEYFPPKTESGILIDIF